VRSIEKGGVGAMELVAMEMKASGQYLSRALSFKNATFEVVKLQLSEQFRDMYDKAVEFWADLVSAVDALEAGAKRTTLQQLW
jgi:hypothetical protein